MTIAGHADERCGRTERHESSGSLGAFQLATDRLLLREWRDEDRSPFAAMGRDPKVMATLGPPMSREQADASIDRMIARQAANGHCFWPLERQSDGRFLGFCGLLVSGPGTPIADRVEIGWRLRSDEWGKGYAREAAEASIDWFWTNTDWETLFAITTPGNTRSWGLMERLGMTRRQDMDFDHPNVPDDSHLKPHWTYELRRQA